MNTSDTKEHLEKELNRLRDKIAELEKSLIEQKKTEYALKNNKEGLHNIIQNLMEGFASASLEGKLLDYNDEFAHILGLDPNKNHVGIMIPDFWQKPEDRKEYIQELTKNDFVKNYIINAKKADGEKIILRANSRLLKDKHGKPLRIEGLLFNITEHKQTEDKLKESEERFKRLFNDLGDAVFVTILGGANSGKILEVNSAAIRQTGYSRTELLQMNIINDLLINGTGEIDTVNWEERLREGEIFTTSEKKRMKDGTEYWTDVIVTTIDYMGEKATLSINHDITKRKRAEQIQKVLYQISNAVLEADDLEHLIKLIRDELGTIIDTTNFYIALYDQSTNTISLPFHIDEKDEITIFPAGKTLTYYVIKTQKSLLGTNERLKELEKTGEVESIGASSAIWLGVPLKIEGKVTGVLAVQSYTDEHAYDESDMELLEFIADQISISIDKKKAEQALIDALNKAEESDRLKSAFLANMSHEIRTPMNGILGFASLLKLPDLTIEQLQQYVSIIEKSGKRMLNIINDLIDISKIEAGQMEVSISECDINKQIEYMHTFFFPEAENNGLKLSFKNGLPSSEAIIKTDREKLYAILTNLVKNAIKYTHEGSIDFGYVKKGEFLEFYVADTGIGIPKDRQKAVFERFVQADIEDAKVYEGAGLGLSITSAYVEMLGGKIWMESAEGDLPDGKPGGSQFYFTIPYRTGKTATITQLPKVESTTGIPAKKLNIIIAEDEDVADTYLTIILKTLSSHTYHAKTGKEAVNLCRNNPDVELILMDIKMPIMGGYEATREIRKFNKDVIIIAQTAFALAGDREKAIEAGCNDYISKPINRNELMEIIGRLC